jgi:hypothetical protein
MWRPQLHAIVLTSIRPGRSQCPRPQLLVGYSMAASTVSTKLASSSGQQSTMISFPLW